MSTLRVLDLGGTGIRALPPSISNLTSLKGLYLNDCFKLVSLPQHTKQLKNVVEILDIRRTGIRAFPAVIGGLTSLRCLRVSFTSAAVNRNCIKASSKATPFTTIQQLSNLEELTIEVDPRDPKWNEVEPEIAKKVAKLEKLSTLSFWFTSTKSLGTFTRTSKSWNNNSPQRGCNFRSLNIIVGSQRTSKSPRLDSSKCSGERYLQYTGGKDTPSIRIIKEVLRRTCSFELIDHESITNFSDFGIDAMDGLEICLVEGCNRMTAFLGNQTVTTTSFRGLKELHLRMLQQLNAISQGAISSDSFASLTTLTLYDCPKMIKVVSWDMARQLRELQHLRVEKCTQVDEIIATENQSSGMTAFSKLKILELVMLEGLVRIHSDDSFQWSDLQKIDIFECNKLENLQLSTKNATKLHCIQCSEAWWRPLVVNGKVEKDLEGVCCFV